MLNYLDEDMKGSFPMFYDGDVFILINPNVFILHSPLLAQKSNTLRRLCNDIPPDSRRYLTLVSTEDPEVTVLQVQDHRTFNAELEISTQPSEFNLKWPPRLRSCWTNLLKIFYNLEPTFATIDPQSFTQEIRDTVRIAEELEISFATGMRAIERALLRLDQILYHAIAMYPASWAGLSKRMHSAVIYQESVIHIVGRWNSLGPIAIASLEPCTRDLCRVKHQELLLKKRTVECRLLSHYPQSIRRGVDGDPSRAVNAGDVYMWMAIAFFRQWMCFSVVDRKTLHAVDGGACFYRTIYSAGTDIYINSRERAFFTVMFSMSTRGRDLFNAKMQELKQDLQSLVAPLLVNRCRYIFYRAPPYLTCCQVDRNDLPWDPYASDAVSEEVQLEEENSGLVHMQDVVLPDNDGSTTSRTLGAETPDASTSATAQNRSNVQISDSSTGANNNGNYFRNVYNINYANVNRRGHMMENTTNPHYNTYSHIHTGSHSAG